MYDAHPLARFLNALAPRRAHVGWYYGTYVGAAPIDMAAIEHRHDLAVQAKFGAAGADYWYGVALQTHTNYITALKFNSAAWDSYHSLGALTSEAKSAIAFDPSLASPADSALVDKYNQEAVDMQGALTTDRQAILADLAGHIALSPGSGSGQSPPVFVPAGPPLNPVPTGPQGPQPQPQPSPSGGIPPIDLPPLPGPAPEGGAGGLVLLGLAGLALLYFVPAVGVLLLRRKA